MVGYAGSLYCVVHACTYDLDSIQGQGHSVMTVSPLLGPLF